MFILFNSDQNFDRSKFRSPPSTSSSQDTYNDGNTWDRIRAQNASSKSAWDKVRERAITERKQHHQNQRRQHRPQEIDSNESEGGMDDGDKYSTGVTSFDLPRTREEYEEFGRSGKIRTNQFGDPEISDN